MKTVNLTLDYSFASRQKLINFFRHMAKQATDPCEKREWEHMTFLTITDDAYFRGQIDAMKRRVESGEYDVFKMTKH